LRLCEAVIEESPLSISAMQTMGLCCEQLGKGGDAADWLQKAATASHSTDADTWIKVGLLFKSSGQYERALKALKRSVSLAPQDAHLLLEVADCYRALGQPDMEARTLERSLRLCFSKIDGRSGSSSAELSVIGESDEPAPASADSEISASVATCSFDLDAKKSEDAVDSSSSTDDLSPSHLRKLVEIVTNRLCTVYPGCKKRMGLISRVASRLKSLDGRGLPASLILRYGAACGVLGRTDTAEACFELVPLLKSTVDSGDANELGVEVLAAVDMAMAVMKDRAARKAKTFPKGNKVGLRTDSTLAPSLFNDTSTPAVVIRRRTERSGALTVSATMDATRAFERGDFVTTLECVRRCAYVNVTSPVVWDLLSYLIHLLKGGAADPGLARYLVRGRLPHSLIVPNHVGGWWLFRTENVMNGDTFCGSTRFASC
jgi:tetratricopeptide (TPR) repeat protein